MFVRTHKWDCELGSFSKHWYTGHGQVCVHVQIFVCMPVDVCVDATHVHAYLCASAYMSIPCLCARMHAYTKVSDQGRLRTDACFVFTGWSVAPWLAC